MRIRDPRNQSSERAARPAYLGAQTSPTWAEASSAPTLRTALLSCLLPLLLLLALPVLAQPPEVRICDQEITTSDAAAGDFFACALALDGTTAVVGSLLDDDRGADSGSLYVFEAGEGGFAETAKLTASDGTAGDQLGFSVAAGGERAAAGAPFRDGAARDGGAVYVFSRDGGGWVEEARLAPDGLDPFDQLGHAVALSGGVLAAGAPGDDEQGGAAGAVWVFELGIEGWSVAARLTASDGAAGDGFGFSLALAGTTLLVGAPWDDSAAGAVYVFERGDGGWVERQKLTAADRAGSSLFGTSVAVDGGAAAVGARLDDRDGADAGAAYVFRRGPDGVWSQEARLAAEGLAAGEELGISVALAGDRLAVGARLSGADAPGAGTVYLFRRDGGAWVASSRFRMAAPAAGDELGYAVGLAGGTLLAGAYRDDGAGPDAGIACTVSLGPDGGDSGGPRADLRITKTDGRTTVAPGESLTYTIRVSNRGPDDVAGAPVTDVFPASLAGCRWTCTPAGGAVCESLEVLGDVEDLVDFPVGATAVYQATCTVPGDATGTVVNTATVTAPEGVTDPAPGNNRATDETRIEVVTPPLPDLRITKTAGAQTAVPGASITYTVTASNVGEGGATAARVSDPFPAGLTCTWTCAGAAGGGCTAGPVSGGIADPVSLPAGGAVTYTAVCAVDPSATGTVTNTATVTASGVPPASAAVSTPLTPRADLALVKTFLGVEGDALVFRLAVANAGPSTARGVTLADPTPAGLAFLGAAAPCAGGFPCALGDLPPGGEPVVVEARFGFSQACGTPDLVVENLAEVRADTPDPSPADNASAATATLTAPACVADLAITKTTPANLAVSGALLPYTVTVTNSGPDAAVGALVSDPFPEGLGAVSWTCTASPGAVCSPGGTGPILDTVTLPAGATVTYSASGIAGPGICGRLTNTASVTPPEGARDPRLADNRAAVTLDAFPQQGLCAVKTVDSPLKTAGSQGTYEVLLVNGGPVPVVDAPTDELVDLLPPETILLEAVADSGVIVPQNNQVSWNGNIAPLQIVTLTLTFAVAPGTEGMEVCNQGIFFAANPPQPTDDPSQPGPEDPTCFRVAASVIEVPTLSLPGLALLALLLAAAGWWGLRRRPARFER